MLHLSAHPSFYAILVFVIAGLTGCGSGGTGSLGDEPMPAPTASLAAPEAATPVDSLPAADGTAIVVDHTCTDLSRIPDHWLEQAKESVVWIYGSTSHGTQIWTGAQ